MARAISPEAVLITERSHLLPDENVHFNPLAPKLTDHDETRKPSTLLQEVWRSRKDWYPLLTCCLLFFVVDFASYMRVAPKTRMFEMAFCREYYAKIDPGKIGDAGDVAERFCKVNEVQEKLALLKGLLGSLECIPGLLLAIPYGILADARGKKFVAALGLTGQLLGDVWILIICYYHNIFPTKLILISPVFRCIGGGSSVMSSVVLAIVASVASPARRTKAFFYMAVALLFSELISPPLGSILMERFDPYVPFLTGIPLEMLGYVILIYIPSTEGHRRDSNAEEILSSSSNGAPVTAESYPQTTSSKPKGHFSWLADYLKDFATHFARYPGLIITFIAFMVNKLARQIEELLIQYLSLRFGWTMAQSGYIISFLAAVHILLLCLVLPYLHTKLTQRYPDNPGKVDLFLARGSIVFLTLGPILMGLANSPGMLITGIFIFSMGAGFRQSIQSFMTGFVQPEQISVLYTTISIVDGIGSLVAAPLLAVTLSAGLNLGGTGIGLPFFVAGGLYMISGVGVWYVKTRTAH